MQESSATSSNHQAILIRVGFAALAFSYVVTFSLVEFNQKSWPQLDELAYLELGNKVSETGGVPGLFRSCLAGRWREANRHPLYLALISLVAERDPSYFARARLLSWLVGCVSTLLIVIVVALRGGALPGVTIGLWLSHNQLWITYMPAIGVEMTLFGLVIVVWYLVCFHADAKWQPATAGAVIGLVFVTKGTGLIVLIAYIISLVVAERRAAFRSRLWVAIVTWTVVASPLLIRNVECYGTPLYNVNSHYMWLDNWSEVAWQTDDSVGESSFLRFIQRNGIQGLARRVFGGGLREVSYLLTGLSPMNARVTVWNLVFGGVLSLLSLIAMRSLPTSQGRWFSLLLVVGMLGALSLHTPFGSHPRFQLTSVPVLMLSLGCGMSRWYSKICRVETARKILGIVIVIAMSLLVYESVLERAFPAKWFSADVPLEDELSLTTILREADMRARDTIAIAPNSDYSPFWYTSFTAGYRVCPERLSLRDLQRWLVLFKPRFLVTGRNRPERWAFELSDLHSLGWKQLHSTDKMLLWER